MRGCPQLPPGGASAHGGRPLSAWVGQLSGDGLQRQAAVDALRAFNGRAVPLLIRDLAPRDGRARDFFHGLYRRLP
jgi:hypothetical protein